MTVSNTRKTPIHYVLDFVEDERTACGVRLDQDFFNLRGLRHTPLPERVTCSRCLRTEEVRNRSKDGNR
jgi:hypothetical protein